MRTLTYFYNKFIFITHINLNIIHKIIIDFNRDRGLIPFICALLILLILLILFMGIGIGAILKWMLINTIKILYGSNLQLEELKPLHNKHYLQHCIKGGRRRSHSHAMQGNLFFIQKRSYSKDIRDDKEDMESYDQSYNYNVNKEAGNSDIVVIDNNDSNEWFTVERYEGVEEVERDEINRKSVALYSKGKEEIIEGVNSVREVEDVHKEGGLIEDEGQKGDEICEEFKFYKREYEDENKEFERVKRLKSQLFSGYYGYDLLDEGLRQSVISELTRVKLRERMEIFLNKLDEGRSYTLLLIIRYLNDYGDTSGYTAGKSYKVNKDINIDLLCDRMMMDYGITRTKYNLYDADVREASDVIIVGKEWLLDEEFKVRREELTKVYNDLLKSGEGKTAKVRGINEIKKELNIENYGLDRYNRILMNNYGEHLSNVVNVDKRKNEEKEFYRNGDLILEVTKVLDNLLRKEEINVIVWNDKDLLERVDTHSPEEVLDYSKLKGRITLSWKDERINDREFIRDYGQLNCIYKDGGIERIEVKYNLPSLNSDLVDLSYDDKIGVLDFETFGNKEDGLGHHNPYAGGWATLNHIEKLYIEENESSEEFVLRFIKSILNDKNNHNRVFYCHNLGREAKI